MMMMMMMMMMMIIITVKQFPCFFTKQHSILPEVGACYTSFVSLFVTKIIFKLDHLL